MQQNGAQQKFRTFEKLLLLATVHIPATIHPSSTVHLLLTLWCFCYIFGFLPILSLLIPSDFGFFFPLVLSIYKTSVYINHLINKFWAQKLSACLFPVFSFFFSLIFLSFSRHFLGIQTPSEDDNLEDERLKPFFLGVGGHWAWDRRQLRVFPCFNGGIFYHLWF